jgi:DNA polymerase V
LPEATADTRVLTTWALRSLRRIYQPGYAYHKAGVMLLELVPASHQQFSLLAPDAVTTGRNPVLMTTLDAINGRYGRGTLRLAVEGIAKPWQMRREKMSPRYTTAWAQIPNVRACC